MTINNLSPTKHIPQHPMTRDTEHPATAAPRVYWGRFLHVGNPECFLLEEACGLDHGRMQDWQGGNWIVTLNVEQLISAKLHRERVQGEDQSLWCRPRSTAYGSVGNISQKKVHVKLKKDGLSFDTTEFLKLSFWFMFVCESIWVCDEFACVYAKARRWQHWVSSSAIPLLISLRWLCYWTWKKTDHQQTPWSLLFTYHSLWLS